MRYLIQNRYQSSGWENLEREQSICVALEKVQLYSQNPIYYGMTRIVDMHDETIIVTYSAGGGPCAS